MKTLIQKWGNSLALRIPKSFANEIGLSNNSTVNISLIKGKMVVTPIVKTGATLEDLLEQVTEDNIHREVDTGSSVGNEAW